MPMPARVAVLHDAVGPNARPDELDTLVQADAVCAALSARGYAVERMGVTLNLEALRTRLQQAGPDVVFNLVESPGGSDRLAPLVPGLLETLELPCTGADYASLALLTDKVRAKVWLHSHGILTPSMTGSDPNMGSDPCGYIVKSATEHASLGLDAGSVVDSLTAAEQRIRECEARFGGRWFAERYIEGREFNIAVLEASPGQGARVLPLAEIRFVNFAPGHPRIVDYAAKWDDDSDASRNTVRDFPDLDPTLRESLTNTALATWDACGLRGYARVDVRVDDAGRVWVVDVNPNPCLAPDAGFAAAAARDGLGYADLIEHLVTLVLPTRACQRAV